MNRFLRNLGAMVRGWADFWAAPIPDFRYPGNLSAR
jgi:hypothetical protein